jgi:trehalose 6-phosphate synthase/phosphatase
MRPEWGVPVTMRLVIVSNRLPIALSKDDTGKWQIRPSSGGLVTALSPVLRERGGLWIGWPGTSEEIDLDKPLAIGTQGVGYVLKPVRLTLEEVNQYYLGFSNEILWPLFHDLQSRCNFDPAYWSVYQAVNRKFAKVVAENTTANDYIWVHDYHLMLVAKELRSIVTEPRTGFFLHTPFPPLDIFIKLPWRSQILRGLLEYDLIGFQTIRDRNNFLHCVGALIKGLRFDARRQVSRIKMPDRAVRVGVFPIGIDFDEFTREAAGKIVTDRAEQLRQAIPGCQIILGVDRLDYSKGIPQKLKAFRTALELFEDIHGKVALIQIVAPSRENIPEYQVMKTEIEKLVSGINGKFGQPGWTPIHYMFRSLERSKLLVYYCAADIALVTPLKDGMNLVAKEYCAANTRENAVLVVSEFAGAAHQLRRNSLVVNPYDIEGVAHAIHQAYLMGTDERKLRMRRLRNSIRKRDIFWWLNLFLRTGAAEPVISPTKATQYTLTTQ